MPECTTVEYNTLDIITTINPSDENEVLVMVNNVPKQMSFEDFKDALGSAAPISNVFSPSGSVAIPAGKLIQQMVIISTGNQTVSIGTTNGGSDILQENMLDGDIIILDDKMYLHGTGVTIYAAGSNSIELIIYTR